MNNSFKQKDDVKTEFHTEPVAWMDYLEHSDVYDLNVSGRGIPLYTHPAKTLKQIKGINYWADAEPKTLTDEEIQQAIDGIDWNQSNVLIRFARAILRKAQEK